MAGDLTEAQLDEMERDGCTDEQFFALIAEVRRLRAASSPVAGPQEKTQVSPGASVPTGPVAMEVKPTGCDESDRALTPAEFDAFVTFRAGSWCFDSPDSRGPFCTRTRGHDGIHIAVGIRSGREVIVRTWERDPLPPQTVAAPVVGQGRSVNESLAKSEASSDSATARSSGDEGERT